MPDVVALYRYPVKGFTPEECKTLTVLGEGRIAGDRVLGIRFADTQAANNQWSKKTGMVALINTPGLARLQVGFDEKTLRLCIRLENAVLVDARCRIAPGDQVLADGQDGQEQRRPGQRFEQEVVHRLRFTHLDSHFTENGG